MPFETIQEAKAFYDRFGRKQDAQSFYEDAALERLIRHSNFHSAHHVFELGCGTGRLACRLLAEELPTDAHYVGTDISTTMVRLARKRLARFGPRAEIHLTDGALALPYPGASFDRFLCTYVLDLLPQESIVEALREARRVLIDGGLLCVAGLTHGQGVLSALVSHAWATVHAMGPSLVGGCRPIDVIDFLQTDLWKVAHHEVVSAWGVPSEVLVAETRDSATLGVS